LNALNGKERWETEALEPRKQIQVHNY